jgi:hypothetical protein
MPARCLKCAEVPIHEGLVRFPKRAARKGAAQPPRETIPDKASSPDNKAGNL